ncbi:MAG: rhomboid family intramembrane serine protease [Anaerolineaceae bacterium]|nr:rhomboid family intramembrane serine protease [Anaerolineaceae bacterium]
MTYEPQGQNHLESPESLNQQEPAAPTRPRARFIFRAKKPYLTYTILSITVIIFVIQLLSENLLGYDYAFIFGGKINELIDQGQYWRLITPVFLHGSITHILFNMYALYIIGRGIELYYGHVEFALLYFLSGIGGSLFSYFLTPSPSLGASGAIFGLIAADAILLYRNKEILGPSAKNMLQRSIMIIAVNLFIGLSPGIDNWGHVGGMMMGIVFAWFAGPMVTIDRMESEIQIRLKSNRNTSIRVALIMLLVVCGLLLFKSLV